MDQILALFCVAFSIFWLGCQSQNNTPLQKNTGLDEEVRYGKLDNGFIYYLKDNDSETTELRLVIKAGLFHEDEDQLEYSHLMEHVAIKYPKNFPSEEKYFNSKGRYNHANTCREFTTYYAVVPSGDKEVLMNGVQLLRDWIQDFGLDQDAIDVERGAILGESRVYNPHSLWIDETIENLLTKDSGFKKRFRKDSRASIRSFNRELFLKFRSDWYRPDIGAAIVVGDINVDSVETEIRQLFSDLKNPEDPKDSQARIEKNLVRLNADNQFHKVVDTVKPKLRLELVSMSLNKEFNPQSRDDYKEMLLQQLYTIISEGRRKLLEQSYDTPFSSFISKYEANTLAGGQIHASAMKVDFSSDDIRSFKDKFFKALVSWKQIHTGVEEEELQSAKDQLRDEFTLNELKKSSALAQKYMHHFVRGSVALNPEEELKMIEGLLDEIDLRQIQAFTDEYGDLEKNKHFIFFKGPQQNLSDKSVLNNWVSQIAHKSVEPPLKPNFNLTTLGDVIKPFEGERNVIEHESKSAIKVYRITLKNGIKLMLKPTEPGSEMFVDKIGILGFRPNRVPIENREDYLAAMVVPELIQAGGAGKYSRFELEKFKEVKDLRLRFRTDLNFQNIEGKSDIENLDELLNLLYLYVDKPEISKREFERWKNEKRKSFELMERSSSTFYMDKVKAHWFPEIPSLKVEDLEQLTLQEVSTAYEKWYSNFNDFTFIITGDFEVENIKQTLINKFSVFPVKPKTPKGKDPQFRFPLVAMEKDIPLENSNQVFVSLIFPIKVSKDIHTEAELAMVGRALNNRIRERLRVGCYAPAARGEWLDRKNSIYGFSVEFNTELGEEDRMISYALEEFRNLKENGVTQEWLDLNIGEEAAKFDRRINSFGYFNFWPDYLKESIHNNEDPQEFILKYESVLKHFLSLEDVNQAAKNYLSEENYQEFKISPMGYEEKIDQAP